MKVSKTLFDFEGMSDDQVLQSSPELSENEVDNLKSNERTKATSDPIEP